MMNQGSSAAPVQVTLPMSPNQEILQTMQLPSSHYIRQKEAIARKKRAFMTYGILQLIFGILMAIINVLGILSGDSLFYVASGIWIGFFAGLTGCFGIIASGRLTRCHAVTFMVLSILCTVFVWAVISLAIVGIVSDKEHCYWDSWGRHRCESNMYGLTLNSFLLVLAVTEMIVALAASITCCGPICCIPKQTNTGVVIYSPQQLHTVPVAGPPIAQYGIASSQPIQSSLQMQPPPYQVSDPSRQQIVSGHQAEQTKSAAGGYDFSAFSPPPYDEDGTY